MAVAPCHNGPATFAPGDRAVPHQPEQSLSEVVNKASSPIHRAVVCGSWLNQAFTGQAARYFADPVSRFEPSS